MSDRVGASTKDWHDVHIDREDFISIPREMGISIQLDDNELELTWEAADEEGGAAGALVKLLILSGAHRNEITELSRDEIKAEAIELPGERTKNGLPHSIPMTPMIRNVLTLPKTGATVIAKRTIRAIEDKLIKKRSLRRSGLGRFTIYDAALPVVCRGWVWLHVLSNGR